MSRPGFLRNPMPPAPTRAHGPVRCGSFGPELQAAPWKYSLQHDREEDCLLWITRGQGRITINGLRRGVSMHHAIFLPSGTLFSLDLQQGTQALYVMSPAGLAPRMPQEPLLLRIRDGLAQAELTGEIDSMARENLRDRPLKAEALEARLNLVAVWLQRQVAIGAAEAPEETAALRLVRRFARTVVRDYRSAASMAQHAEALGVTATHLSRTCRQCCGKTAADLLTERKLHAARLALESPRPPVQEVARSLGFASPAYFTRFIQAHTGMTPSALRAGTTRPAARRA